MICREELAAPIQLGKERLNCFTVDQAAFATSPAMPALVPTLRDKDKMTASQETGDCTICIIKINASIEFVISQVAVFFYPSVSNPENEGVIESERA